MKKKWDRRNKTGCFGLQPLPTGLWFPGATLPASRSAWPPPTYRTSAYLQSYTPPPTPLPPQGIFLFLLLKNRASVRINGHPPKLLKKRHHICTDLMCGAARYRRTGRRRSRIPIIWRGGSCGGRPRRVGSSGGLAAADGIALEAH